VEKFGRSVDAHAGGEDNHGRSVDSYGGAEDVHGHSVELHGGTEDGNGPTEGVHGSSVGVHGDTEDVHGCSGNRPKRPKTPFGMPKMAVFEGKGEKRGKRRGFGGKEGAADYRTAGLRDDRTKVWLCAEGVGVITLLAL
jgi:hypothetical protein